MYNKKIVCNATNSAATDSQGYLWVWGTCKYGLCGNEKDKNTYYEPKLFELKSDGGARKAGRDGFTRKNQKTMYKVKDIAMGTYHMVAIAFDSQVQTEFVKFEYASEILEKLYEHLEIKSTPHVVSQYQTMIKSKTVKGDEKKRVSFESIRLMDKDETVRLEAILEYIFEKDQATWPYGSWITFQNFIFEENIISYSDELAITLDRLQ